ncbi:MAG: hypothetical protein ABIO93_32845 [Dyadobacter sp.]|uniref:hypothetical protein n=1 Tax=Dyadobacter sp. TaxID=1914288 RepID=UPI00326629D2
MNDITTSSCVKNYAAINIKFHTKTNAISSAVFNTDLYISKKIFSAVCQRDIDDNEIIDTITCAAFGAPRFYLAISYNVVRIRRKFRAYI